MPGRRRPATRSLGLPVSGPPIGMFSLFRLPLGAFRPHDLLYVYEEDGRLAGLIRVERDAVRDEWTIVELDAIGSAEAGDIRFRLVQQLAPRGAEARRRRGSTSPAPTRTATSSCSCRPASCATATSASCSAPASRPLPDAVDRRARHATAASGRPTPLDALAARPPVRGGDAAAGPAPRGRSGSPDWERQGSDWRVPRSQPRADPPLRRRRGVRPGDAGRRQRRHGARRLRPGRRREGGPAALPQGPGPARRRRRPLVEFGLGVIAARTRAARASATTTASSPRSGPTNRRSTGGSRRPASVRSRPSPC